jgi:outer membrane protein OmpA-like peptidoglycan-associated protein
MSMLKDDTKANEIFHGNQKSSSPRPEGESGGWRLRLAGPGAACLLTLALFGYAISAGSRTDQAPVPTASVVAAAGGFAPQAGWIDNLKAQLPVFGYGNSLSQLTGTGLRFAALPPSNLPKFVEAAITDTGPADIRLALSTPSSEPGKAQVVAAQEEAALNSLSVAFPSNSAKIPSREAKFIRKAVEIIKTLPAGSTVELIGSAEGAAPTKRGAALAQERADSVYKALVRAGVDPAMLTASSAIEGRSSTLTGSSQHRGRRVEFRVAEPLQ